MLIRRAPPIVRTGYDFVAFVIGQCQKNAHAIPFMDCFGVVGADLFPADDIRNVHIFDKVFAVGASLGHPPIATEGHISYMDDEIDHHKYWMSSAQTIFGNSGGAIYRWSNGRKKYEFLGIPSRISVQPMGFSSDAITHMGYFIPITRVYALLDENFYHFIYQPDVTYNDCMKLRNNVKENEIKDDEE